MIVMNTYACARLFSTILCACLLAFAARAGEDDAPQIVVFGGTAEIAHDDESPSPDDLTDFGNAPVDAPTGGTVSHTFTINNAGLATLTIHSVTISTIGPEYFTVTIPPADEVPPDESTSFEITFDPGEPGLHWATVTIDSNDPNTGFFTFMIEGTGTAPEIEISGRGVEIENGDASPGFLDDTDFGAVPVVGPVPGGFAAVVGEERTYTITNRGTFELNLFGDVMLDGPGSEHFRVSMQPATGILAADGGETTFSVTFAPMAEGTHSATVVVISDDVDEGFYSFTIQGTGTVPEITVRGNGVEIVDGDATPAAADGTQFGGTAVDMGMVTRSFSIINDGLADLHLTGLDAVAIGGPGAEHFYVTTPPGHPVGPGGESTFDIVFDPTGPGVHTATVTIENDDPNEGTYTFTIQGTGQVPEIDVSGNGTPIANNDNSPSATDGTDFGNAIQDVTVVTHTFSITNNGLAALNVSLIELSGPDAGHFAVSAQPATPVAAGASTTFQITFDPQALGPLVATVGIFSDDADEGVYSFDIIGTGVVPPPPVTYAATLTGPNENPPNASPGVGTATVTYDATAHTLRVQADFSGLVGTVTAAHIHGPVTMPGGNAGVATTSPSFAGFPHGGTSGTYDTVLDLTQASSYNASFITASGGTTAQAETRLMTAIADGNAYFNIHTNAFPGGEIRGFFALVNAPIVVNTTDDTVEADAFTSLREAIDLANAQAGDDTIYFDHTVFAVHETIVLGGTQLPNITTNLTITGPDAGVTVSGDNASRVFQIDSGTVSLSNLTIANGSADNGVGKNGYGGGIYVSDLAATPATVTLTHCTFTGNHAHGASGWGGAIGSYGTVTLTDCTLSGNSSNSRFGGGALGNEGTMTLIRCVLSGNNADNSQDGGGAISAYLGTLTLTDCTLTGNHADNSQNGGGAIYVRRGTTTVTGCTFSGNHALGNSVVDGGGAILVDEVTAALTLVNCTLSQNSATYGGAVSSYRSVTVRNCTFSENTSTDASYPSGAFYTAGTLTIGNTILHKGSAASTSIYNDGSVISAGFNLSDDATGPNNGTTDRISTDPKLGALADNGGPTLTHALLPGSPALDAGNAFGSGLTTDQRGQARPVDLADATYPNAGDGSDIGAFEAQSAPVIPTIDDHFTGNSGGVPAGWTDIGFDGNPASTIVESGTVATITDHRGGEGGGPQLMMSESFGAILDFSLKVDIASITHTGLSEPEVIAAVGNLNGGYALVTQFDTATNRFRVNVFGPTGGEIILPGSLPSYAGGPLSFTVVADGDSVRVTSPTDSYDSGEILFTAFADPGFDSVSDFGSPVALVLGTECGGGDGTSSIAYDRVVLTVTSAPAGQEIRITGNGQEITSGDTTPSADDHTDFGSTAVAGGTVVRTFTIANTGTADLTVTGVLSSNPEFSIPEQPESPVSPGGSVTFLVIFDPSAARLRTATVTVTNSDPNEGNYTFAIAGTGTVPPPTLGSYSAATVVAGRDGTVAPSAAPSGTVRATATARSANPATAALTFNGLLTVNPATGAVRVTNAMPAGIYTVTVRAFNSAGASATETFTLSVTNPVATSNVSFTGTTEVAAGGGAWMVTVGDFNEDGHQDLATADYDGNTVSVRLGDGAGNFTGTSSAFATGDAPYHLAAGDFNGDGHQDLAVAIYDTDSVLIRLGDGTGNFSGTTAVSVGNGPNQVAVGDFNGDGKADLATADYNGDTVSIRLGDGAGGFSGTTIVSPGNGPTSVAVGDFNGDGKEDLAIANYQADTVSIRLGDGAGGFSGTATVSVGDGPEWVVVGDFNGDGKADLATANDSEPTVSIRLGDGTGNFTGTTEVTVGGDPWGLAVGDFNGDGKQDLASTHYFGNTVSIRLGDGTGAFTGTTEVTVGADPYQVVVGDFNGDGKQDLATANYTGSSLSIRLNNIAAPAPEIRITGNGQEILDGDTTPATADDTDFGMVLTNGSTTFRTFTIANDGTAPLTLTGTVHVTLSGDTDFTISEQPSTSSVGAGGSTTFQIAFDPSSGGLKSATVTVTSDDADEGTYTFAIAGTGVEPTAPTVTTPTSTDITATTATLGGNVTSDGGESVTARGVVFAPTATDSDPNLGDPNVMSAAIGGGRPGAPFTVPVTGLTPNTSYSFKAYATNSVGTSYTTVATFTTDTDAPPTSGVVVGKGAAVAGEPAGTVFYSFGIPSINSGGTVAVKATLKTGSAYVPAIVAGDPPAVLVRRGDSLSGLGATYVSFDDVLLNEAGKIAFTAKISGPADLDTVICTNRAGSLGVVAREGGTSGVTGATFSSFLSVALSDGALAFTARLRGSVNTGSDTGIWIDTGSGPVLALREGGTLTVGGAAKTVRAFSALTALRGAAGQGNGLATEGSVVQLIARVTFTDNSKSVVALRADGTVDIIATKGETAPGSGEAKFSDFSYQTQSSDGRAAFIGTLTGGDKAIFAEDGTLALTRIAAKGETAPDTGGAQFYVMSNPVNNDQGDVAWMSSLKGATPGTDRGIWWRKGGAISLVAQEGGDAAGTTGVFHAFKSLALSAGADGAPLFTASLRGTGITSANNAGLWAMDSAGDLQLLLQTGDSIDLGGGTMATVKSMTVLSIVSKSRTQSRAHAGGAVILRVTLVGSGGQAIVKLLVPQAR